MDNISSVVKRFMKKVVYDNETSCWNWIGSQWEGYGRFGYNGKTKKAHRFIYELATGNILDSKLVIDHLCQNRSCVNPDHLDPVTQAINIQRMDSSVFGNRLRNKTHCKYGHEYTTENTRIIKCNYGQGYKRKCKTCHKIHSRKTWNKYKDLYNSKRRISH